MSGSSFPSEQRLRESERRYCSLVRATSHVVWTADPSAQHFTVVGGEEFTARGQLAYSRAEALELTHPEDRAAAIAKWDEAILRTAIYENTQRVLRSGGEWRVLHLRAVPVLDDSGNVVEWIGASNDITDISSRIRAEEALRANEELFRTFMNHAPAQVWIDDEDGVNRFADKSLARELRRPVDEIVRRPLAELMPGARLSDYLDSNRQVIESGESFQTVVSAPRHDGSFGKFLIHKFPLSPAPDGRRQVGGVSIDVTERERAVEALRAGEENFRTLFDYAPDGILIADPDGYYRDANASACRMLGYSHGEMVTFHSTDVVAPAEVSHVESALNEIKSKSEHRREWLFRRKDGSTFAADVSAILMPDGNLMAMVREIAERKRAEDTLRLSEERFRNVVESSLQGIIIHQGDTIRYANPAASRMFGWPAAGDMIGRDIWETLVVPEECPALRARIAAAYRGEQLAPHPGWRAKRADGSDFWVATTASRTSWDGLPAVVSMYLDITERKQAEQMLAESELRLRTIFDNEPECVKLLGAGCSLLEMNPAGLRMIEADSLAQVLGQSMLNLILPAYRAGFAELSERVLLGESGSMEFEIRGIQGTHRWLETHAVPMHDGGGEVRILGITRDITERKRAGENLRRTSDLLTAIANETTDAVFVKDRDGRYLLCNPAAARFMGRSPEDVIGHTDAEFFDADSARLIADRDRLVRESGQTETQEEELTAAGTTRTYLATKTPYRDAAGTIVGIIGIARDISDRKRLEKQFLQAQKMEAVGLLAGGVAHDFNNLLTIISGYSDLLLGMLPTADPMSGSLKAIGEAGERAAALTRQLLAFSRQSVLEPKVLDLNAVVGDTGKMLRRLLGEDVLLATVLDPKLDRVKVDPGQLEQVLMNMAVNARDAMPKGGKLTVETRNVEWDDRDAATRADCKPGRYVMLAMSDMGDGMTPEVKARIFEPFFTTKGVGKGTGLGLAMVFGFVRQSGGAIEVYSELGFGTTFKIYLPAVAEQLAPARGPEGGSVGGGTETILLVEDEDGVRALALLVLQGHGYKVLAAGDGKEALRAVDKHRGPIDMLVTDVVMPGMDGRDLAEALRRRFPQIKVLFSSGYTDDAVVRHGVLHEEVAFLQKPYSPRALGKKVREVLDKKH